MLKVLFIFQLTITYYFVLSQVVFKMCFISCEVTRERTDH